MSAASDPQPPPTPGQQQVLPWVLKRISAWGVRGESLAAALTERAEAGEKKYGTRLQTFNGRNALIDAYQEAQDAVMYLAQRVMEDPADVQPRELLYIAEDLALGLSYHIERLEKKTRG